jgi:CelD/BcsL family acetyltransferase involved in cellulose biosynthesis
MTASFSSSGRFRVDFGHELAQVDDDWRQLEQQGLCTAFQTRAWLQPFYRVVAPGLGLKPAFLRVTDTASGEPMLLFLLVQQRCLGVTLLQHADAGVSDYNAPLVSRGFQPSDAEWAALWRELMAWPGLGTVFHIQKAPLALGGRGNPLLASGEAFARMGFNAWGLPLPATMAAYEATAFTASFAKDLAMRQRRLGRKGAVVFMRAETLAERQAAFEALVEQRRQRFVEMGRANVLDDALFRRFYEAAAVESPGEVVRLFTVQVGGTIVAVLLALDHGGARHVVMPTFAAGEWRNCSPGTLLIRMSIERSIAEGLRYFDFTIGDEPYKASFGACAEPMFTLMHPLTPLGHAVAGARSGARRLPALVRDAVHASLALGKQGRRAS